MQNSNLNYSKIRWIYILNSVLILGFLVLIGCEGERCGQGIVYDSKTKVPLDSVLCTSNGSDKIYTDSIDKYYLCGPFGGCIGGCPDVEIEFSKSGYKSQKVTNPNKSDIFLEKE